MVLGKKKVGEKKTEREKVEERREEVLKQGRKFKYPLQYSKSRMIVLTVIIAVAALIALTTVGWVALYRVQSTGDMLYRLTRVLPVPVAKVDEEEVRYSDYLMIYRSSITPVEEQGQFDESKEDVAAMKAHYKRAALDEAEDYAYALKLAEDNGIEVTETEIDKVVSDHRTVGGVDRSEESFTKILRDNFGLSMTEYRRMVYLSLIKAKVSEKIDTAAMKVVKEIEQKVKLGDTDLAALAETTQGRAQYEETGGLVDKMNVDGGRAAMAMKLNVGQVSEPFISNNGDEYFFVKLIERTESEVNYASLRVPLTEFDKQMSKLREEGKVEEYIKLEDNADGQQS